MPLKRGPSLRNKGFHPQQPPEESMSDPISRSRAVCLEVLERGGLVTDVQLKEICQEHGLGWPGANGGLFGGRSPWMLSDRNDVRALAEPGRRRLGLPLR